MLRIFEADTFLKVMLLFFRENKMTFHVNRLLGRNSYEVTNLIFSEKKIIMNRLL